MRQSGCGCVYLDLFARVVFGVGQVGVVPAFGMFNLLVLREGGSTS